jgi:hypothetical protein
MARIQQNLIFSKPNLNGVRQSVRMSAALQATTVAGTSNLGGSMYESITTKMNTARPQQIQSARPSYGGILDSNRPKVREIKSAGFNTQRVSTVPQSGTVVVKTKRSKIDWSGYRTNQLDPNRGINSARTRAAVSNVSE